METIFPPSKIARLTDSSSNSGQGWWSMKRNGSPSIGLGLALGNGGSTENRNKKQQVETKSYGFTVEQMQELRLQTVIYKYIEAGCAVPYNLVLPIWRSVSHSSFTSNLFFPPHMRGSREMQMDPEPGRCKRTDGKKWRCSKEAVLDQKYCERHMHRGRQRTRKLMQVAAQLNNNIDASTNLSICLPENNSN